MGIGIIIIDKNFQLILSSIAIEKQTEPQMILVLMSALKTKYLFD